MWRSSKRQRLHECCLVSLLEGSSEFRADLAESRTTKVCFVGLLVGWACSPRNKVNFKRSSRGILAGVLYRFNVGRRDHDPPWEKVPGLIGLGPRQDRDAPPTSAIDKHRVLLPYPRHRSVMGARVTFSDSATTRCHTLKILYHVRHQTIRDAGSSRLMVAAAINLVLGCSFSTPRAPRITADGMIPHYYLRCSRYPYLLFVNDAKRSISPEPV